MPVTPQQAAMFAELRLAGASTFEAVETIRAAQTADRAIELSKAWQRERRNAHGEFTKGLAAGSFGGPPKEKVAARRAALHRAGRLPATASDIPDEAKTATVGFVKKGDTATQQHAHEEIKQHVTDLMHQVEVKHEQYVKEQDTVEGKKSKKKFAAMALSLVAGSVLGYVEARMGLPDAAQIASTITPAIAESAFEWKNRL